MAEFAIQRHPTEVVKIADLKPHPKNYRRHPDDQVAHIAASLEEHGLYRNVVLARDGTILAGHGVIESAKKLGATEIDAIRLDIDPDEPKAIKILTGDNELGRLAEIDDRALSEHLRVLAELGELQGTGFDDQMLAGLVYVTRLESEVATMTDAEQWVGMPDFGQVESPYRLVVQFDTAEARDELMATIGVAVIAKKTNGTWSIWWPPRDKEDLSSLKFVDGESK